MTEKPIHLVEREAYYAKGSEGQMQSTFNVGLPEIYQIEVTNACNFTCDFCPRDLPGTRRPDTFIDVELVRTIVNRDLGGSYFVEFQLAGEPTLHKDLAEIIDLFKGKVLTGLSTNGSSIHGKRVLEALVSLDYLTISIDSVEDYEKVRPGGKWQRLVDNIDLIIGEKVRRGSQVAIDLQLIEFPGVEKQRDLLLQLADDRGWGNHVAVRRIPDCFLSTTREMREVKRSKTDLCLNPWMSVTVQADGDVTPCCFSFGKEVVYGNLRDQSLAEIWQTSPALKVFREMHAAAAADGSHKTGISLCDRCYERSPVMLHWDLYTNAVKKRLLTQPSPNRCGDCDPLFACWGTSNTNRCIRD